METIETSIKGLLLIKNKLFSDNRGGFLKIFNEDFYKDNHLSTDYRECYFSISHKNVIRGMHFQIPPADHEKIVYVSNGAVVDVVVDILYVNEGSNKPYKDLNGHIWIKQGPDKRRITENSDILALFQSSENYFPEKQSITGTTIENIDTKALDSYCIKHISC